MRLALAITAGMFLWPIQYFIAVPAILVWRLVVAALRIGLWAALLLLLPIVGWLLLAFVLIRRPDHEAERLAIYREVHGLRSPSLWRPWLI